MKCDFARVNNSSFIVMNKDGYRESAKLYYYLISENKIHSYPTKYPCLVSFYFENNKIVSHKIEVKDILETLRFMGILWGDLQPNP